VKAKMWKSRFLHLQAACQAAQAMLRQGRFPGVHPSRASPEHDILGARWFLLYKGCQFDTFNWRPCFFVGLGINTCQLLADNGHVYPCNSLMMHRGSWYVLALYEFIFSS